MDQLTHSVLLKQIDGLNTAIDSLIKHRETITDNTEDLYVADMETILEPIDTQILSAIDGIASLTVGLDMNKEEPSKHKGPISG